MRAILVSLTVLLCSSAFAQTEAQSPYRPLRCFDDNLTNRCDPGVQRATRAKFGASAIEDVARDGVQTRRVFFVNGYGGDMPMVAFERAPGQAPRVRVVGPRLNNDAPVTLTASIDGETWRRVMSASTYFHRELAPESGASTEEVDCLHAWVMTAEAADPGDATPVRSRTSDACNGDLLTAFAFELAELALQTLPQCSGLDAVRRQFAPTALFLCTQLDGDYLAAGETMNRAMDLSAARGAQSNFALLIHDTAQIEWAGEREVSGFDAWEAWPRLVGRRNLRIDRVTGEGGNRANVRGFFFEWDDADPPRMRSAPVEQIWVRENGFDFRMKRAVVGSWSAWERPVAP